MGPNGEPVTTPPICLNKTSLKMNYDTLVAKDNVTLNSDLFKSSILSFWSYINSVQMLMVSSSGMLIKSESTSKLPKHNPDEVIFNYSKISLSDAEKSLLVRELRFSLPPEKLA